MGLWRETREGRAVAIMFPDFLRITFTCLCWYHWYNDFRLTYKWIPQVPVGDAVWEGSGVGADVALMHGGVVVGVHLGQVNEDVVIRRDAGALYLSAWKSTEAAKHYIFHKVQHLISKCVFTPVAVVVRITGHQRSSVQVGRQNKALSPQPVHHNSDLESEIIHHFTHTLTSLVINQTDDDFCQRIQFLTEQRRVREPAATGPQGFVLHY